MLLLSSGKVSLYLNVFEQTEFVCLLLCFLSMSHLCICVCVCVFTCVCVYLCVCVQHLQEGRKAQQHLDQCWKQMDNVSVEEGG